MNNDILQISKNLGIRHNVYFRVIDKMTNTVVQQVSGHNDATNSMLTGIGYYLAGNGAVNQAYSLLTKYVPKYISLGTMGLLNQSQDADGLPAGIDFDNYVSQVPGYGADGWDSAENNNRQFFGLGFEFGKPPEDYQSDGYYKLTAEPYDWSTNYKKYFYKDGDEYKPISGSTAPTWQADTYYDTTGAIDCELISDSFPRMAISFRDVVPEVEAELPKTVDVIYSAMISIGALQQFRGSRDYIFITEAGLWSEKTYQGDSSGENGLLAGYRILPPNSSNWDMSDPTNQDILKHNILRVGKNQVVQVIWKLQLGSISQIAKVEDQDDINELLRIIG